MLSWSNAWIKSCVHLKFGYLILPTSTLSTTTRYLCGLCGITKSPAVPNHLQSNVAPPLHHEITSSQEVITILNKCGKTNMLTLIDGGILRSALSINSYSYHRGSLSTRQKVLPRIFSSFTAKDWCCAFCHTNTRVMSPYHVASSNGVTCHPKSTPLAILKGHFYSLVSYWQCAVSSKSPMWLPHNTCHVD